MAPAAIAPPSLAALCSRWLPGHRRRQSWELLQELADYCREHAVQADVYGDGDVLRDFEAEVATRLGYAAAVFMPSGTMAQQIALRIWAERAGGAPFAMHPTCHLELHEQRGYARLHGLNAVLLGERWRPLAAAHLAACPERLAALVVELPMREIGGVLPEWAALEELKEAARARRIPLHLDGARLWETAPYYGRSYAEICRGFASVYVSFYKGIGNLSGAMLAGDADVVAEARVWLRRHGGNLYQLLPYVASARLNFAKRLAAMPTYYQQAQRVAGLMAAVGGVRLRPARPQINMVHALFDRPLAVLKDARDQLARAEGVWLLNGISATDDPDRCLSELSFGDAAADFSDAEITGYVRRLMEPRA